MAGRRPYVDSTTGIRYDTSNPDFQGCGSPRHGTHRGALDLTARAGTAPVPLSLFRSSWLTKQSAWLKDWRRRYFILKGSKLFFAKVRTRRRAALVGELRFHF